MLAIVDYGRGNLRSVQNGFRQIGAAAQVSGDPETIAKADGVVFPGVGAFRDCMQNLAARGLDEALRQVIRDGKPVLAICVGMQALLSESEEFGTTPGLDIVAGQVRRFPQPTPHSSPCDSTTQPQSPRLAPTAPIAARQRLKVPHMGWNQLHLHRPCPLLNGLPERVYTYFVHSYYAIPTEPAVVVASTDYGVEFASVLWRDNLYATQFHPEKSQTWGLRILRNFAQLL